MNREEATDMWELAQIDGGCICGAVRPPCSFCEGGFAVDLEEYLSLYVDEPNLLEVGT